MKWISGFLKFIAGILCILGIAGFTEALLFAWSAASRTPLLVYSFLGGGILFLLLWFIMLGRGDTFWSTLEHELTHALFALLFFKRIRSLSASGKGNGFIKIEGGNMVIALAPYFFPLAAMIVLTVKPFIQFQYQAYLNGALGFTYLFHLMSLFREFHPGQPDLHAHGFWFSTVIILFLNLVVLGLVLVSLSGEWRSIPQFFKIGFSESFSLAKLISAGIVKVFV